MSARHLTFIGAGSMGGAMLREVLRSGLVPPKSVTVVEASHEMRAKAREELGVHVTDSASEGVARASTVMTCVKPALIESVMRGCQGALKDQLFVSIAAGVPLSTLQATTQYHKQVRWARVMPNVACLVGASASTYYPSHFCRPDDVEFIEAMLGKCGIGVRVPAEQLLDAATGVAGSGIAYIFLIIEALADGGVREGLPRPMAQQLAVQTVLGGALLQMQDNKHPGVLKDTVCSPGGTTIEAVASLERSGLRSSLIEAVHAAASKAKELGSPAPKTEKKKDKEN